MTMPTINVKFLNPNAKMPYYASKGAAGADLIAAETKIIHPGGRANVGTGLAFEIPEGWEVQIRPRSGHAFKAGVTVLNAPGTVDSDYRGEIGVLLINHGQEDFIINPGDRIAQMVVARAEQVGFAYVEDMTETERGAGGFGSTGLAA